jgi:hypothetical protein
MVVIVFVKENLCVGKNEILSSFSCPFFLIQDSYIDNFFCQERFKENESEKDNTQKNYHPKND